MNQLQGNNQVFQQLAQTEQLIQQLMKQTQQASGQYQQLLRHEQNNAVQLEQIAKRKHQAAQIIQRRTILEDLAMHQFLFSIEVTGSNT